jgi:hypothetical protein
MNQTGDLQLLEYYTIEYSEAGEHLTVVGKMENGSRILISTFEGEQEEQALDLINSLGKSPNYLWDFHGKTKILRKCIRELTKSRKTGDRHPFYYAILSDGEEFPIVAASE